MRLNASTELMSGLVTPTWPEVEGGLTVAEAHAADADMLPNEGGLASLADVRKLCHPTITLIARFDSDP